MKILKKDLRLISLIPCVSKVAEEFVVCKYIKPAVLNGLDMTNIEMTSMSQCFVIGLRAPTGIASATTRKFLFDYGKDFNLNDQSIIIRNFFMLDVQKSNVINSIIEFLSNRSQRIKLGEGYVSYWGSDP